MKVYILVSDPVYDAAGATIAGGEVIGVFSSREKADEAEIAAVTFYNGWYNYTINEIELDYIFVTG